MSLDRQLLVRAFPDDPRLRAELEQLSELVDTAQGTLEALNAAIAAAQEKLAGLSGDFQPANDRLAAIAGLENKEGAVELLADGAASIRGIDTTDPASLLSRSAAYSVLIGRAGKGTTAQRPVLAASQQAIYFDTTLAANGKPIFWTGAHWVDSGGAIV